MNKLLNVYAITPTEEIKLNEFPVFGDSFDISCWADLQIYHIDNVVGFEYVQAKCFGNEKCIHLEYAGYVPYHPIWKCANGGKIDEWVTTCYSCPFAQEILEP